MPTLPWAYAPYRDLFGMPTQAWAWHPRCRAMSNTTDQQQNQQALERAAEELKRSNQDLEQFAYVASHDLQEPLRMVSGFLQLLEERYGPQLDDKAREYIGYAVEGAERMSEMIRDLLAYSRVGRRGRLPRRCDAEKALAAALANLAASIREAGAPAHARSAAHV